MHHFVVSHDQIDSETIYFSPAQSHQIARVLRLRDGDEVVALDGLGTQYRVALDVDGKTARGRITGAATECHEPRLRVTLLAAPPRGDRWEWLLQKCTEVGVARFVPLVTRYSQPGAGAVKPRHYEIVREAAEQCRRLLVPEIAAPRTLESALREAAPEAATILLWEAADGPALLEVLHPLLERGLSEVRLIVGPEGGLPPHEVALAREYGAAVASLGPLILRAETAAVVACALALNGTISL